VALLEHQAGSEWVILPELHRHSALDAGARFFGTLLAHLFNPLAFKTSWHLWKWRPVENLQSRFPIDIVGMITPPVPAADFPPSYRDHRAVMAITCNDD
jgi:hypothetical protein